MKGVKRHYKRRAESRSASLRKWLLGGDLRVNGSWPGRLFVQLMITGERG